MSRKEVVGTLVGLLALVVGGIFWCVATGKLHASVLTNTVFPTVIALVAPIVGFTMATRRA